MSAVHALSIHADYRCGRSGACCTSAWPIPVERALARRLRRALGNGRLDLRRAVAAEAGAAPDAERLLPRVAEHASVLGSDARGRCVFFEPGGDTSAAACALQRQLGPNALPVACRFFPRVCLLEPRGVSVTLSHYCPTAAALLFRDDVALEIVRDPPAFPAQAPYEGLDARAALPPLLRPGVLCDWESHALWEAHAVATFARDGLMPEAALGHLTLQAEVVCAWSVKRGPLADWLRTCTAGGPPLHLPAEPEVPRAPARRVRRGPPRVAPRAVHRVGDWQHTREARLLAGLARVRAVAGGRAVACWPPPRLTGRALDRADDLAQCGLVIECVPASARPLLGGVADVEWDAAALDAAHARYVTPAWGAFARPVRRYLAAHAFASWCAHQGRGLRTRVLYLGVALAVLRVQAARVAAHAGRVLDRGLFIEAVRAADLLLVHLVSRETLAASLSLGEDRP